MFFIKKQFYKRRRREGSTTSVHDNKHIDIIDIESDSAVVAFNVEDIHDHHVFLPHVLSRKKQIIPALSQLWG